MGYNKTPVVVELGLMKSPNPQMKEPEDFLKNNPDQVFIKNFLFSADDTNVMKQMENSVWKWLAESNPEVTSSSQSMMFKDGKYHVVLTVFFKYKGE